MLTLLNAPKRGRTYPNMNAMLGIRCMHRVGGPGVSLPRGSPKGRAIPIGTIPGNSFIHSAILYVSTAYGAGFTIDVGGVASGAAAFPGTGAFTFPISTVADISAVAKLPQTLTFGYVQEEMEIYARLNGAGDPATGGFDYVIQFYTNQT